jgi:N-acetylglucosaminyl-diphospho-decaprenol L-rhamnosyltransferase
VNVDLSILIVSWNTRDLLARCLETVAAELASFAPDAAETLVVDNASHDGSAALVSERFPWARLIVNDANVGFARANNQAFAAAQGRYLLLLNPDTSLLPGALRTLLEFLETHPAVGAVGARLLNPDGSLQPSCSPAPTLSRELWRLFHLDALRPYGVYAMSRWDTRQPRPVEVVQGACLLLRREALGDEELLDPRYFMYSEEVDLCYRIRRRGWQIYWVPTAQVIHYGGQSTRQVATAMFLRLYEGKILYFRKLHGPTAARLYKAILLAAALSRLLVSPLAWLQPAPQRHLNLARAGQYVQLLKALPRL